ncbi:MAG: hypothetical protein RTU30_10570 [Candidatus Thorarchaeota archaeon]
MASGIQEDIRTWVTWQKTVLLFQIMILIGIGVQLGMFFALLWWGRPVSSMIAEPTLSALVLQFFVVAALWILIINISVVLFWWVTKQGQSSEPSGQQPVF